MFDQADRQVRDWVQTVLGQVHVTLEGPHAGNAEAGSEGGADSGVSIYLIECASAPPPRGTGRPPLQIMLRYLVTTWAREPEEAHRLLGELLFAALDTQDYDVELTAPAAETWTALGVKPQPAFMLGAMFKQARAEPPTRYVRQPLVVQATPIVALQGVVVGPGEMPVAGARVEAVGLNMYERTDGHGRFRFSTVPSGPHPISLRVKAKGREIAFLVPQPISSGPITIKFDMLEG